MNTSGMKHSTQTIRSWRRLGRHALCYAAVPSEDFWEAQFGRTKHSFLFPTRARGNATRPPLSTASHLVFLLIMEAALTSREPWSDRKSRRLHSIYTSISY